MDEKILEILETLSADIKDLKSDVKELKTEQSEIKSDLKELKTEQSKIKSDLQELKTEQSEIKSTLDKTYDQVVRLSENQNTTDIEVDDIREDLAAIGLISTKAWASNYLKKKSK